MQFARRTFIASAAAAAALAVGRPTDAATFPTQPVKVVLGFNAGGNFDTLMRLVSERAGPRFGHPMVIENRGGAGGGVAATFLRSQRPDGHTIAVVYSSVFTLNPLMGSVAYSLDDFRIVLLPLKNSSGIIARADAPFSTWAEFVEHAKRRGSVSFGTAPLPPRMVMERIAERVGFSLRVVQSRGGAETRSFLLGGHIEVGFGGASTFEDTRPGGPFKLIALFDAARNPDVPETPTLTELGFDYGFAEHLLIVVPKAVPDAIAERLTTVLGEAMADEAVAKLVRGQGWTPMSVPLADARSLVVAEAASYARFVR